jgi:hypothetical protein
MRVTVETKPRTDHRLPHSMQPVATHKTIDWFNGSDRIWLKNHMHWCILNQHCVSLTPAEVREELVAMIRAPTGLAAKAIKRKSA